MDDGRPSGRGRRTQPTVLVSGQARTLLRRVPLQLLAERASDGDGAVVATTREDPAVAARRLCEAVEASVPERVAVVDCCNKSAATPARPADLRWRVPSPVAFGPIAAAVGDAFGELADRGVGRAHFLLDTLATQFRLAAPDRVNRHVHDLAMAVGGEGGLGLFTVAPSVVTDREFARLKHLFDVHVEVRRAAGTPEVRWTGLVGRSDGWVPLADAGFRFDALGTRLE